MIYFLAAILAFCSISYELLLSQMLSAFLGNTVLRYSVTIGLYMASMGVGAFLVRGRIQKFSGLSLLSVEILLTLLGAASLPLLFLFDSIGMPDQVFVALSHSLIIFIGVLTGMEIPLLVEIRQRQKRESEGIVIGIDYFGAFLGTLAFAFYFYPELGLFKSSFSIAALNALAGLMLICLEDAFHPTTRAIFQKLLSVHSLLFIGVLICWAKSFEISNLFLSMYMQN